MATIKEVAKAAGVSYQAVSAVLNGNQGKASPATRERIFQAVAKLNYRPNTLARALRSGRSHTIGLVVGNLIDRSNHYLAEAVMSEAEKHGYRLIISVTRFDRDREREALLHMLHRQVDGIIYNLSAAFDGEFFRQRSMRYFFVNSAWTPITKSINNRRNEMKKQSTGRIHLH